MTKFSILYEKWVDSIPIKNWKMQAIDVDIFVNPSRKELSELRSGTRGWVSPEGDLYMGKGDFIIHNRLIAALTSHPKIKTPNEFKSLKPGGNEIYNMFDKQSPTKVGVAVELGPTDDIYVGESYGGLRGKKMGIMKVFDKAAKKNSVRFIGMSVEDASGYEDIPEELIAEQFYTAFDRMITGYTEVFANPTSKEIKEIEKQNKMGTEIRIIGDEKLGIIFAFSSNVTHYDVHKEVPASSNIHMTYYEDKDGNWYVYTDKKKLSKKLEKLVLDTFPKVSRIKYADDKPDYKY